MSKLFHRLVCYGVNFNSKISRTYIRNFGIMNRPNGILLQWNLSANDITERTKTLIEKTRKVYDEVASLSNDNITVENTLMKLAHEEANFGVQSTILDAPQHLSPDKDVRTASTQADKLLSEFGVEISMRQDVFDNLVSLKNQNLELTGEVKRYLERLIRDGKRNGLHLEKSKQEEVKALKKKLSELCIEYSKNCNEENTILEFTKEELVGLPEDFLERLLKTDDGSKYKLSLKYPDYFPAMKNARNPNTRKIIETAFSRRCINENTPILEELVRLRYKKARILGFEKHSDFIMEVQMAKTSENVMTFLNDLARKMKALGEKDIQMMLKIKKTQCEKYGYEFDNKINYYDLKYFMDKVEKEHYSVDHEKLKEFFPMEHVTQALLNIYQNLLCVKFSKLDNVEVWHDEVTCYSMTDSETDELMGYFYLDLYPREGKYGHAAVFPLQSCCVDETGKRRLPVVAMVTNFPKPVPGKPTLLSFDDVETFFHEFGHVMHGLCSRVDISHFSGTKVERDFVEAPSQMLENWCWSEEPLKVLSKHFQSGESIPDDLLQALIKSRNANTGVFNLRQLLLGQFDMKIHSLPEADTAKIFHEMSEEILMIPQTPGTNMPANFEHLAGGYDARYYSYMWSEVFSMDMFYSRFKKEGLMNPSVGKSYRESILKPGGSKDAIELLRDFLGREPNQDAFLKSKGLSV